MTEHLDTSHAALRKFGILFGVLSLLASAFLVHKGSGTAWLWLLGAAVLFLASGLIAPALLRPVYVVWMKFAFVLGWVNTRLLLGLFYYLVLSPIGLLLRLLGKDLLQERRDPAAHSYWIRRAPEPADRSRCERMF